MKINYKSSYSYLILIGLALLVLCAVIFIFGKKTELVKHERIIQYSFSVSNETGELLNDAYFHVYAPVKRTSTQSTASVTASHPYVLKIDDEYNQLLEFKFDVIAPYETRIIRIRVGLEMLSHPDELENIQPSKYLGAEPYIEINAPLLVKQATLLKKNSDLNTAQSVYDWVSEHINYTGYIDDDLGALSAMQTRIGDCTEYMNLFSALMRIHGIPTRQIGGFIYENSATLKARDYHNWSEIFIDKKWHIVDPQKKSFLENYSSYIAMRVIKHNEESVLDNSHQLAFASAGLKIKMN